eukprot:CAMPEP_0194547196 /NCGR_PEP_ID=MMETSP0253-20130528/91789_1 /TAXON_ID=2966 /ORGANISM="Noctiluca scintillans" /LENGTH=38 /DNA_ID= /DNA_START= /DNA_END= /DNA_ORIENTATION=
MASSAVVFGSSMHCAHSMARSWAEVPPPMQVTGRNNTS